MPEEQVTKHEDNQNWYFTFCGNHTHPNGYVKINGTFASTRSEMVRRFDTKWGFQYNESQYDDVVKRYGLYEVK